MYKKGETIIYPVYGMSKIARIYKEKVGDKMMEYYEIMFKNNLYVSVPIDQAENLGMRYPTKKTEMKKVVKDLNKKVRMHPDTIARLADISKEKLATGMTQDAVDLVRMIYTVGEMKKTRDQNLSLTERTNLAQAIEFIRSEIVSVFGEKGVDSFGLSKFQNID